MSTLDIQVDSGDVTVMRLTGDLDGGTYKGFQDKAAELVNTGTQKRLVDLASVGYMGSAGFRALHAISNMLDDDAESEKSTRLKLLHPSDDVRKIIKTLGFDIYFDIFDNSESAVASFD